MPTQYSTDEILINFDVSSTLAMAKFDTHITRCGVIAMLLFLAGLTALFYSEWILAAALICSALHFDIQMISYMAQSNMTQQNVGIAHLIASIAQKIEGNNAIAERPR